MSNKDFLQDEAYRDRISSVTESGKRNWIYALKPDGKYYNIRNIVAFFYVAVFFIMPFIKVNDMPFFLINVVEGKFILFSKIFWPQDFFIFAIAMVTLIVFIVLLTVVFGRIFCGWACPQTFFMEFVFRKIEWLIEGSPNQQRKLNEGPWNRQKVTKKVLKHGVFLSISFIIANTFLAYIISTDELFKIISEPVSQNLGLFVGLVFFTLLFYSVFAYVREIVCTTICPYGRLQGVMFDKDTMQIAYDYGRGEPRGKFKKNEERTDGDCINCYKCVAVCPTGIDIRNGVQMECVGCTACIDACDDVMEHVGLPKGLIRYASENEISKGNKFHFNNRMKAYTALLVILILFMSVLIATRSSVDVLISRAGGQIYHEVPGDKLGNLYDAKIINKTNKEFLVYLKLEGVEQGEIKVVGNKKELLLKEEAINELTFFIEIPKSQIKRHSSDLKVSVYHEDQLIQSVKVKFLGPFN
jgi:cytochrome c oxidase accessory protein FixG